MPRPLFCNICLLPAVLFMGSATAPAQMDGMPDRTNQPAFGSMPAAATSKPRPAATPLPYGTPWSSEEVLTMATPAPRATNSQPEASPLPDVAAPAANITPAPAPAPAVYTSGAALDDKRKLIIGDRLGYQVLEDKNPAVGLAVMDDGDIDVPLLGRVAAAGKTCQQIADELKPVLERTYFYKATVILALDLATERSPGHVYVAGMVMTPGPQDMPPGEVYTLSKAITRAGGIAQFGNEHRVKIVRKDTDGTTEDIEADIGDIIYKGHIDKDPVLEPNDLIVVPRKLINF